MGLFGPSKREVWNELAEGIGAKCIRGGLLEKERIEYKYKNWFIYLDTYTVHRGTPQTGRSRQTYTRMRAPFINKNKIYFKLYREGLFSNLGKALGMQDIEIGNKFFDDNFIIKGNNEFRIKKILLNKEIRDLIEEQNRITLQILDTEGIFGPRFNDDESEIYFIAKGTIKDTYILKSLFELFTKLLDEFVRNEITIDEIPQVKLYKD